MARFGQGAFMGLGVVNYGTTGTAANIDFLLRAMEGSDSIEYKRNRIDPRDLSDYDELIDQVQPGEEMVDGSTKDKCTFAGMQDIMRMMTGSNPTGTGTNPTVYSFTSGYAPLAFSNPSHYSAGSTGRAFTIELYRGAIKRKSETQAATGTLTIAHPAAWTVTRATSTWDTDVYQRGTIFTISGAPSGTLGMGALGVYVVESVSGATLTLATVGAGWHHDSSFPATGTVTTSFTVSATYQESTFYQDCEIKKLALDWKRNDWVERSLDWMGTTFQRGPSSHSYRQAQTRSAVELDSGTTAVAVTPTTITRTDTGGSGFDWFTDGYVVGGTMTVHNSDTAADIGVTATISSLTSSVMTLSSAVLATDSANATLRISGSSFTGAAEIYGAGSGSGSGYKLFLTDYATSNPGMGATKFLNLGGTTNAHICREATLSIEDPLVERYDIGQSTSEQPLPDKKRTVTLDVTIETNDETFLEIVKRPDTKSFGASGAPTGYTGTNRILIQGAGSTFGRYLQFSFPRLTIEGPAETKVESIGVTTVKLQLRAMSDGVTPAYTCIVANGDATYRT